MNQAVTRKVGALRVASANLQYGGIDADGGTGGLEAILDLLRAWRPEVLLLQEVTARADGDMTPAPRVPVTWAEQEKLAASRAAGAEEATIAHLARIAGDLGMTVASLGPARTESFRAMHCAVLASPALEVVSAGPPVPVNGSSRPAWAEAVIRVPGALHDVAFYSVHLPARSGVMQRMQAEWLASLIAQQGRLTVAGGDWNTIPRSDKPGEEALRAMNPHLRASRMTRVDSWELRPDYAVDDLLVSTGLTDAAACMSPGVRQPCDLAPTGPAGSRVDRFYVTSELVPALRGYSQADSGGSDHHALYLDLARDELDRAVPAGYRP